jgi:hypothetical protein
MTTRSIAWHFGHFAPAMKRRLMVIVLTPDQIKADSLSVL